MTTLARVTNRRTRAAAAILTAVIAACAALALAFAAGPVSATTVSPYLQVSDSPSAALATQVRGAGLRDATVGFIVSGARACTPAWDGASAVSRRPFARQIASLARSGVHAALSFGGQQGRELALSCGTPRALAAAYGAAAAAYGTHTLDFDLEGNGLDNRPALARRMAALRLLQQRDPRLRISLTLPVDTTGLPSDALAAVRSAARARVRLYRVNVMAMDFGDSSAPHPQGRMEYFVRLAAQNAHRQLAAVGHGLGSWRALAVTPMVGVNDNTDEVFGLADARALASWARSVGVGEIRYWSFNRDRSCAGNGGGAQDTCSGVPQRPGAFASALRG